MRFKALLLHLQLQYRASSLSAEISIGALEIEFVAPIPEQRTRARILIWGAPGIF